MKKLFILSIAALTLASCATLTRKNFTEKVTFAPEEPKDAYLYIDGEYKGVTPVTLELDARNEYDVKYTKRGYLPNKFDLSGRIKPKYVLGNLATGVVVFGWIPMLVDAKTEKWKGFDQMDVDYKSSLVYWTQMTEEDIETFKGELFEIDDLYFELGKSTIQTKSYPKLDEVVGFMKKFPSVKFEVRGHTDSQGNDDLNKKLSKDRAESVDQYLIGKGIDASRLTSIGFGETMPITTNETKEGRARNRRVEFKLL